MSGASWTYDTAKDSELSFVDRLKECPREPDPLVYAARVAAALAIRATLRICHHFDIVGREHLPREGSFVLVANHASHLDALALLSALPLRSLHRAYPLAARDYFGASDIRLAVTTIVANVMLFDRTTPRTPREHRHLCLTSAGSEEAGKDACARGPGSLSPLSLTRPLEGADKDACAARALQCRRELQRCKQTLDNSGNVLVMFPEGTRSLDGRVGVFRRGIGLLLAGTRYPVLPCYLDGTFRAWPKGSLLPRPAGIRLVIGKARTYEGVEQNDGNVLQICADLRRAVVALAPQPKPQTARVSKEAY